MILYYRRRCRCRRNLDNKYVYDFDGDYVRIQSYDITRSRPYGDQAVGISVDLKMCEVIDVKDAMKEVNLFMDANNLHTNCTSIFKKTDDSTDTYIVLWEDPDIHGGENDFASVCFVLTPKELNSPRYTVDSYELDEMKQFCAAKAVCPIKPDTYYIKYMNSKKVGDM